MQTIWSKTARDARLIEFARSPDGAMTITLAGVACYTYPHYTPPPTSLGQDTCRRANLPHGSRAYTPRPGNADAPPIGMTPEDTRALEEAWKQADPSTAAHLDKAALIAERQALVLTANSYDPDDAGDTGDGGPDTAAHFAARDKILSQAQAARQAIKDWDAAHPAIAAELDAERRARTARRSAED